jgi:hypothetical protein
MGVWIALGVFLLGCGVGALLTRIAMTGQIRRLKAEIGTLEKLNDRAA